MLQNYYIKGQAPAVGGASVGAQLPKTGITTSQRTGDDGDLQAGRNADFYTLSSNNPFSNTDRFTDELGGTSYTKDIVIDWSTYDGAEVLGYYRVTLTTAIWTTAVDNCLAHSVTGFTSGWRMPNAHEMFNLMNESTSRALNWSPINQGAGNDKFWTSSANATQAIYIGQQYLVGYVPITQIYRNLPVRNFTVTGTTLT